MYFSLKTKLFIILSLVMGVVLAIQLYLFNQAQHDLYREIDQISNSLQYATNSYFTRVISCLENDTLLNKEKEVRNKQEDKVLTSKKIKKSHETKRSTAKPVFPFEQFYHDSNPPILPEQIISKIKQKDQQLNKYLSNNFSTKHFTSGRQKSPKKFQVRNILNQMKKYSQTDSLSKENKKIIELSIDNLEKGKFHADHFVNLKQAKDLSKFQGIPFNFIFNPDTSIIEININLDSKPEVKEKPSNKIRKNEEIPPELIFHMPDFSIPDAPRLVRLKYNTGKIKEALISARDRNITITLLLFFISIIALFIISGRFLRPITLLKNSFDQVVNGKLDIFVPVKTKDEIADLTRAFNHMVDELRKNKEKEILLQRKERLASVGQLVAGVAHEIKNPLNAINLSIEHLRDKYTPGLAKQAQKYIQTIQDEIRRLNKTVNNFLTYLRSENLKLAMIDMNRLVDDIVYLFERELEQHKISVKKEFHGNLLLEIDAERFKTVLMNIVLNAIEAMPDGGELQISIDQAKKTITVKDTGCGIEQKQLENIFDLFYTTKSSGTGLGLPTAYKIVKAHGGEITINSEVRKGTEVKIVLFNNK